MKLNKCNHFFFIFDTYVYKALKQINFFRDVPMYIPQTKRFNQINAFNITYIQRH